MTAQEDIVRRFFEALDALVLMRKLRGVATFARRYGIDRRNLAKLRRDPSRGIFRAEWLAVMVEDWHVSPRWLLTGDGGIFDGEGAK